MNWSFTTDAHISWSTSCSRWDGVSPTVLSGAALTFQVAVFLRK